jgi:hypothetical protein
MPNARNLKGRKKEIFEATRVVDDVESVKNTLGNRSNYCVCDVVNSTRRLE